MTWLQVRCNAQHKHKLYVTTSTPRPWGKHGR
jgi:hypothetical protein